jgi:hypothetical protein
MLTIILPGYFILIASYSSIKLVEKDLNNDSLVRVGGDLEGDRGGDLLGHGDGNLDGGLLGDLDELLNGLLGGD